MTIFSYIMIGFAGGIFSGAFGIGGGAVMVPLLVMIVGLSQHQAQGTVLATLLAPVAILAVMRYYQEGNVKVNIALMLAVGFIVGGFIGAHYIQNISDVNLKRAFGIFLVLMGIKMTFLK